MCAFGLFWWVYTAECCQIKAYKDSESDHLTHPCFWQVKYCFVTVQYTYKLPKLLQLISFNCLIFLFHTELEIFWAMNPEYLYWCFHSSVKMFNQNQQLSLHATTQGNNINGHYCIYTILYSLTKGIKSPFIQCNVNALNGKGPGIFCLHRQFSRWMLILMSH